MLNGTSAAAVSLSADFSHSCRAARRILLDGFTSLQCLPVRDYPTPGICKFLSLWVRPVYVPLASVQWELMLWIHLYREFFSFFALLLRATYYRLFQGLLPVAFVGRFHRRLLLDVSRWFGNILRAALAIAFRVGVPHFIRS